MTFIADNCLRSPVEKNPGKVSPHRSKRANGKACKCIDIAALTSGVAAREPFKVID